MLNMCLRTQVKMTHKIIIQLNTLTHLFSMFQRRHTILIIFLIQLILLEVHFLNRELNATLMLM